MPLKSQQNKDSSQNGVTQEIQSLNSQESVDLQEREKKAAKMLKKEKSLRQCKLTSLALQIGKSQDPGAANQWHHYQQCHTSKILPLEEGGLPQQVSNKTECALPGLVTDLKQNYYNALHNEVPGQKFCKVYTFNSAHKSMSTVIQKPVGTFHMYSKGASEIILRKSNQILNQKGNARPLKNKDCDEVVRTVIEPMACEGLQTICTAYQDFSAEPM